MGRINNSYRGGRRKRDRYVTSRARGPFPSEVGGGRQTTACGGAGQLRTRLPQTCELRRGELATRLLSFFPFLILTLKVHGGLRLHHSSVTEGTAGHVTRS